VTGTSTARRVLQAVLEPRRKLALKIFASLVLISWLVHSTDRSALADALLEVDLATALLAVVLLFGLIGLQAWRWTLVARALGISLPLVPAWLISLIGAFFNQVLPSSIGGDAMRIWRLQRRKVPTTLALTSVFLDRVSALIATTLIVAAGLPSLLVWMDTAALRAGVLLVVVVGVCGVCVVLLADRAPFVRRLDPRSRVSRVLQVPMLARRAILSTRTGMSVLVLSLVIQLGVALTVWLLARAIGVALTSAEAAFLVPLVILFSMVPITIAGWGVREGAMVVALGTVGVGSEAALAISVLFGVANAIAALPGGVIWLTSGRSSTAYASSLDVTVPQARS
jgi:uncharacterized protein (TIRG00374 family)